MVAIATGICSGRYTSLNFDEISQSSDGRRSLNFSFVAPSMSHSLPPGRISDFCSSTLNRSMVVSSMQCDVLHAEVHDPLRALMSPQPTRTNPIAQSTCGDVEGPNSQPIYREQFHEKRRERSFRDVLDAFVGRVIAEVLQAEPTSMHHTCLKPSTGSREKISHACSLHICPVQVMARSDCVTNHA